MRDRDSISRVSDGRAASSGTPPVEDTSSASPEPSRRHGRGASARGFRSARMPEVRGAAAIDATFDPAPVPERSGASIEGTERDRAAEVFPRGRPFTDPRAIVGDDPEVRRAGAPRNLSAALQPLHAPWTRWPEATRRTACASPRITRRASRRSAMRTTFRPGRRTRHAPWGDRRPVEARRDASCRTSHPGRACAARRRAGGHGGTDRSPAPRAARREGCGPPIDGDPAPPPPPGPRASGRVRRHDPPFGTCRGRERRRPDERSVSRVIHMRGAPTEDERARLLGIAGGCRVLGPMARGAFRTTASWTSQRLAGVRPRSREDGAWRRTDAGGWTGCCP